jgi:glycosyltransferase involved in cell wall biosynthesis
MKILVLGSKEYPAMFQLEGCGGIEVHVQEIIRGLQKRSVDFFLVTRKNLRQNATEHQKRLHIYRVPNVPGKFFRTFTFNLISFFVSLHLVKKYGIQLIHANDFTSGLFGAFLKDIVGRPLLLSAPAFGSRQPEWPSILKYVLRFIEEFSVKRANYIFLFSNENIRYARDTYRLTGKKIEFLGNGVDVQRFKTAKPLLLSEIGCRIQPGSKIITFVGRITKSKGVSVLIQAFTQLSAKEDAFLFIVGDGPDKPLMLNLVAEKCLEGRVVFLGPRRDVDRLLKISDIFVLPSLYEGFPIALLEAMAAEKPVVATRVGAVPMVVEDGVNGILVKPGNPQDLFDKLLLLLRDRCLCAELAERAYRTVSEDYSWGGIAEKVYNAYLFLIKEI